jgi:hypothetical protein
MSHYPFAFRRHTPYTLTIHTLTHINTFTHLHTLLGVQRPLPAGPWLLSSHKWIRQHSQGNSRITTPYALRQHNHLNILANAPHVAPSYRPPSTGPILAIDPYFEIRHLRERGPEAYPAGDPLRRLCLLARPLRHYPSLSVSLSHTTTHTHMHARALLLALSLSL